MGNFSEITDAAKTFACTLYRQQPGALIPNPASDLLFQIWDGFCGDEPPPGAGGLPAPPAPPFSGGQCNCVRYRASINATGGGLGNLVREFSVDVWGPITGFRLTPLPQAQAQKVEVICRGNGANCGPVGSIVPMVQWGNTPSPPVPSFTINSIIRLDGQPDNCGNPPAGYPPAPPPPPGGYTSPPTPITFNNQTTNNYYFNFTPPTAPATPANFFPPIIINYLKAEANPEFSIPIEFNFNGDINFGGGGDSIEFNQDDRDNIENINNNVVNQGNQTTNIQNQINNIINITNNKPPDPNDFKPPVTGQPPGEYEQTFLGAVQVLLTEIPLNAQTQFGDGAPNVVYAGWFEFRRGSYQLPREPIHFERNVFIAPKGVDGFAYTLYNGFNGEATSIIYKEKI